MRRRAEAKRKDRRSASCRRRLDHDWKGPAVSTEKAISIRAPWWWFILRAGKDLENRDRAWHYRGPILLHASKCWVQRDIVADFRNVWADLASRDMTPKLGPATSPVSLRMMRDAGGCIVGRANVVDCITASSSYWFQGTYALVLRDVVALETPVPFKGALGLFDVPRGLVP